MGHFNLSYYEQNEANEWKVREYLQIKVLSELSGSPFLNVIMTSAGLRDYYRRVGIKRNGDLRQNITEIIVDMMALEMILDLNKLTELSEIICTAMAFKKSTTKKKPSRIVKPSVALTSQNMPMLHLNSKGFTIYMPMVNVNKNCSVLIVKVDSIRVTPNLDNPLQRSPVRTDVFYKAAQMGILGLPGASVEDRQYELTLFKISAATGDWEEILTHFLDKDNNFLSTNPAFEWNNQNRRTQVQLNDIFSNFTFTTIYAPYVTYNNVLICGQAVEFNCTNDFMASINMLQLQLMATIANRLICISKCPATKCIEYTGGYSSESSFKSAFDKCNFLNSDIDTCSCNNCSIQSSNLANKKLNKSSNTSFKHTQNMCSTGTLENLELCSLATFDVIEEDTEFKQTDSGIKSLPSTAGKEKLQRFKEKGSDSSLLQQPQKDCVKSQELPNTVSFVAGIFLIKLYDYKLNDSNEKDKIPSTAFVEIPLFSLTLSQPSFMLTQNIKDIVIHISIFDFLICSADLHSTQISNDFPEKLFSTRQAELTANRIPQSLITLKFQSNATQLKEVDIELSKHIFVSLNERRILRFSENLLLLYGLILEQPCLSVRPEVPIVRGSKIKLLRLQFFDADHLNIKCNRMTVNYVDRDGGNCKFILPESRAHVKFLTRPEKGVFNINFDSFYFQTDHKVVLHPVCLRLAIDLASEPWYELPLMNINANINVCHLDVGILNIIRIKQMLLEFEDISKTSNQKVKEFMRQRNEMTNKVMDVQNLEFVKCPSLNSSYTRQCEKEKQREEHYQDDLRAGAFQFVELNTDTFLPLPYQIQIIKKNFGIVCWRYPQPRKMSKIIIFPILMDWSHPINIKCSMEYFSDVHENFLHYCDFILSETEMQEIEQPKRRISATIWRVVIPQTVVTVNGECFESSEEDEELEIVSEQFTILHIQERHKTKNAIFALMMQKYAS